MIKLKIINELGRESKSILHYWINNAVDETYGGFAGEINELEQVVPKATKGLVLNARLLWTFSAAYNFYREPVWLTMSQRAYHYLMHYFHDKGKGGFFWAVDHEGRVVSDRKQIYGQGFVIYGLSEYFKATGDEESLQHAIRLFELIEKYSFDEINDGYIEALSRAWERLEDMRLSEKDGNYPKSMNTHLHILEPYSNLFRVWPSKLLKDRIKGLVEVFLTRMSSPEGSYLNLFFEMDWTIKSNTVSYGHNIEAAWLLNEAALLINDPLLIKRTQKASVKLVSEVLKNGLAPNHSVYYEKNLDSGVLNTDRHWWGQAEAMVGLLDAHQTTGNPHYLDAFNKVWGFIKENVVDREHGEWIAIVRDDGKPCSNEPKVDFWKCPYHNSRALFESMRRLKEIGVVLEPQEIDTERNEE